LTEIAGEAEVVSRRREALRVAEEIVSAIELDTVSPRDAALRASRLARLLDDSDAIGWLSHEIRGYPQPLTADAAAAARRSGRDVTNEDGETKYWIESLGVLTSDARLTDQIASSGAVGSGDWAYRVELDRRAERQGLRDRARTAQSVLDRVIGEIHGYASARYQELRFGAAVENAFEQLRVEVDGAIGELVPSALPMLSAAFENVVSDNPEHWAGAAATCRRLLKAVADELRPPGPLVTTSGRTVHMGDENYVNRLVDWIQTNEGSSTAADVVAADLEYLGRRLDALNDAGNKGAHSTVTRLEASRYITGTYVVLGDVLRLRQLHPLSGVDVD
jgi:hypothetical protein